MVGVVEEDGARIEGVKTAAGRIRPGGRCPCLTAVKSEWGGLAGLIVACYMYAVNIIQW
jgi:hypothetical protein